MKAFGWAVMLTVIAASVSTIVAMLAGWDVATVQRFAYCIVIMGLCEKVWGE